MREGRRRSAVVAFVFVFLPDVFVLRFPLHAEGGIGQHVIELLAGKASKVLPSPGSRELDIVDLLALMSMSEPQMA